MIKSLKNKIILSQLAIIFLSIVVLGISSYFIAFGRITKIYSDNLQNLSYLEAGKLMGFFQTKKAMLERVSLGREFQDYHLNYRDLALGEYLSRFKDEFPKISFVNKDGQEQLKIINSKLSEHMLNISRDPDFQNALLRRNKVIITEVKQDPDLGVPVVNFISARYGYFGEEFLGVLIGALPLQNITEGLTGTKIGRTGFLSLIDGQNRVLYHPQQDRVFSKINITAKTNETKSLFSNLKNSRTGFTRVSLFGLDSLVAYAPINEVGWSLLVVLPYREFMEVPNNLKTVSLVTLILIFSLSIFISVWLNGGITRPISKLVATMEIISKGDLSKRTEISSGDEIGKLARIFNTMLDNLESTLVSKDKLVKEVEERKRAEEELKNAYDQLKAIQAQLVQSAKMASVGLLAGGVAHEINNPLTGVLNNVQLIKIMAETKSSLNLDEFKELLQVVEESAMRCKKITQSLLDFSRASTGTFKPICLNETIEKISTLIEHEMILQNITLQKEFEPGLPQVAGEPQLLQQAVFDIISNAKWAIQKAHNKEGGTITLKTSYDPQRRSVCLSISDTGIGIAKEDMEKIFEPFFTTKSIGEGTGLGLSIAYNIIKVHHGTIEAESEVGKGATFKISLPAA